MSNKRIAKIISSLSVALVVASQLVLVLNTSVFAAVASDYYKQSYYNPEKTAKLKIFYLALKQCLQNSDGRNIQREDAELGKIFGGADFYGAWVENEVGGSYKNGHINCDENNSKVVDMFISAAGMGWDKKNKVICNGDNDGLIGRRDGIDLSRNASCKNYSLEESGADKGEYTIRSGGAVSHLNTLYNEAIKNLTSNKVSSWQDPSDAEKYYIYKKSFEVACGYEASGGWPFSGIARVDGTTAALRKIDANSYGTGDDYYQKRDVEIGNGHHGLNKTKCSTGDNNIKQKMSDYADAARAVIAAGINERCKTQLQSTVSIIVTDLSAKEAEGTISEEEKEALTTAKAFQTEGKYSKQIDETNADSGFDCVGADELPGLPDVSGDLPQDEAPGSGPDCYSEAGSLGWIGCPVKDKLAETMLGIYDWIANFLEIDPALLTNNTTGINTSGTYMAWEQFRNIANIVFVIFLLIIIISQVTGFGVSNYGIKKSLPKVIVSALLINLSFIICQVAVDLSNIIGVSLASFLAGIASPGGSGGLGEAIGLVTGGALGAIAVGGVAIWASGGAVLVPILLFLLSAVLAVIMLFVTLFVRQATVVILVALSPLAFACFMLPNMEGLFKKWFSLFKIMLLVFPICALLIGGGIMAHNILWLTAESSTGSVGFFMKIGAASVAVFPFFAIPFFIKNSLSALGAIGAKLQGAGSWAQGKVKNERQRRNAEIRSDVGNKFAGSKFMAGEGGKASRFASRFMSPERKVAARKAMAAKDIEKAGAAAFLAGTSADAAKMYTDEVAGMSQAQVAEALAAEAASSKPNIARMSALGMAAKGADIRKALASDNISADQAKAISSNILASSNAGKIKEDDPRLYTQLKAMSRGDDLGLENGKSDLASDIAKSKFSDFAPQQYATMNPGDLSDLRTLAQADGTTDEFDKAITENVLGDERLKGSISAAQRAELESQVSPAALAAWKTGQSTSATASGDSTELRIDRSEIEASTRHAKEEYSKRLASMSADDHTKRANDVIRLSNQNNDGGKLAQEHAQYLNYTLSTQKDKMSPEQVRAIENAMSQIDNAVRTSQKGK